MRRFLSISLVTGMIIISFSPGLAPGQEPDYASLKLGLYVPESDDLENFSTNFYGEIAFGHYYTPHFAVELGAAYFQTDATFSGASPALGSFVRSDDISAIPITFIGKGIIRTGRVEIFGAFGGGVYFADKKVDLSSSALGNESLKDDTTAFGLLIGIGAHVDISPTSYIGVEGRYLIAEADFSAAVSGVPVITKTDLDGFTVTLVISNRFRFGGF